MIKPIFDKCRERLKEGTQIIKLQRFKDIEE